MTQGQEHMQRHGIGMTSQRTRERLIQRLYEEGLSNAQVLEVEVTRGEDHAGQDLRCSDHLMVLTGIYPLS